VGCHGVCDGAPVWNPVSIGRLSGGDGSPSSSVVGLLDGQVFIPVWELDPLSRSAQESVGVARSSHSTDSVCATHQGPQESLRTGSNLLSAVQPLSRSAFHFHSNVVGRLAVQPCRRCRQSQAQAAISSASKLVPSRSMAKITCRRCLATSAFAGFGPLLRRTL